MHAVHAVLESEDGVHEGQAPVVVAVPVDLHGDARVLDDLPGELDEVADAVRRGVPHGVAETESCGAMIDGGAEQGPEVVGARPRGVLRHERDLQALFHGEVDGFGGALGDELHGPVFGELANGGRADEGHDLHGDAGLLAHFHHGLDVADQRAPRAGGANGELLVADLFAEREHIFEGPGPRARKAHVGAVHADLVEQVQDLQLVADARVHDGRVLDAVA